MELDPSTSDDNLVARLRAEEEAAFRELIDEFDAAADDVEQE